MDGTPEKDANALSFFEITLHRGRVAQLQGCTGAGLHCCRVEQLQGCTVAGLHRGRVALLQGCTGAPQDLLMKNCSAFSFFSSRSCCSPSVAHKASLQSKGFRIERDRSWTEFRQIPEQQHYNGRAHFSQREYSGHWI